MGGAAVRPFVRARDLVFARRADGGTGARGELAADADVSSFAHVGRGGGGGRAAWPTGFVNVCDDVPAAAREWVPAFCRAVGVFGSRGFWRGAARVGAGGGQRVRAEGTELDARVAVLAGGLRGPVGGEVVAVVEVG